jgi:exonuclease SbcC
MRPLRLLLDGFGSYREPAEADFTGVDFFALVGPTGSGKSTVIDGLCFALYGTVPRWGKENVIAQALAPAANACRVALVFEAAGNRYGAVRALARNARGQVHTKEARLERLSAEVPADAPLEELLAASAEQLAEGPDQVKAAVQEILGLTYEHFTQSVLLPQGRFSEFLHAKAADRQDLLVELLAFGVYNTVGQKARERAKLAGELAQRAKDSAARLPGATQEAEDAAAAKAEALGDLGGVVEERLAALRELSAQASEAAAAAQSVRAEASLLATVKPAADVSGLAQRIAGADRELSAARAERDRRDQAETEAMQAREALPDKSGLLRMREAYGQQRELGLLAEKKKELLTRAEADAAAAEKGLAEAEAGLEQAQAADAAAERQHAAVAVAQDLRVGEDCPVCLRPVTELPHHPVPAGLAESKKAVDLAAKATRKSRAELDQAVKAAAGASAEVQALEQQINRVTTALSGAAQETEVRELLEAIDVADERLARASNAARAARAAAGAAERDRAGLDAEEKNAWAAIGRVRDSVVQLGAPLIDGSDLAAAWRALIEWAKGEYGARSRRLADVDEAALAARAQMSAAERELRELLAAHGVEVTDVARAEAALATHRERAAHQLEAVRENRKRAAELDALARKHGEDEQVAVMLGRLLRATSFERWLCGEALDSLVAEASETLMELSGGQYQLDRDDRNDLVVIDFQDAGARRPVHTLSGGETFQASLALALALSRQVIGLSAGMRDLNSMFLDEGFGTLDEDTLEVVGSTLERLSSDSDRMIGIITHVPALAERAPVRFLVSRAGTTSTLRREGVVA